MMLIKQKPGQRRFFYHYNKQTRKMTVHWQGVCFPADELLVMVPAENKKNRRQPRVVMQGWANDVQVFTTVNNTERVEVW